MSPKPSRVLFLTAHPDDEVMFFAPAILALTRLSIEVHALCLSIGDADGAGHRRRDELQQAYRVLGVPSNWVQVVNDP